MQPKLLQINVTVNSGSVGRMTEDIANVAISSGYKSFISYGRNNNGSSSSLVRIGNNMDVFLHGFFTRIFDKHGLYSKRATKKYIRKIEDIKPDIVHIHNIHGYYLNYEILFKYLNRLNIPIVCTFYDCWPITGHCTYFDFVGCTKWQTECNSCPNKKAYPKSVLFDNSRNNFIKKKEIFSSCNNLTIVVNSVWLSKIVASSFLQKMRLRIINTGIDLKKFQPSYSKDILQKYAIPEDKFIILGVANNWNRRKGLDDFLQLSRCNDETFVIVLIGLSKNQQKKLPENIIGVLRTESTEELSQFYSTADIFVNPTWADNYPTTNIEALACGTPVITYNTGGSPEILSEDTGFVIEKGDITGIKQVINKVRGLGKDYFSEKCRRRAIELFNKDDRYNEYITLYNSLLKLHEK